MAETPAIRASDADRERMVAVLREHATEGRLTLQEFTERMSVAYEARTIDELDALARDLPAAGSPTAPRRHRTRLALAVFASNRLEGRLRIGRRVLCLMGFGNIDLDLRRATFDGDVTTIVALGMFGAIDVYVPEGIEVDLHGLAVFGHRQTRGNEVPPHHGTPLIRVFAFSMFAGIDVWRVPAAWAQRTFREVIRGIRAGAHKELRAP
jgi:Domain of unknown function (DUF1707)/Cell wall-active antibiotics response 4TMS YvqF